MLSLEVEYCANDGKLKELSKLYHDLHELDPEAAERTLYTVDVPLGKEDA